MFKRTFDLIRADSLQDSDGVGVLFDVLDRVTDLADVRGIAVKVGRLGCRRRDHAADDQAGR